MASDLPITDAEAAQLFAELARAPALILAVSGGPDSTALMWLAARWRAKRKHGPKLIAVTVDHALRKESAGEARAVVRLARKFGVAHRTLRWTGQKPKTGIQEAARNARYRLLADAARKAGARHVLTAHTRDDQAETVLFRLARGSGLTGLRGMARLASLPGIAREDGRARPDARHSIKKKGSSRSRTYARVKPAHDESIRLIRPLLSIPKSRLLATLELARLPFADDPTNRDPRFARPRLRELMPGLAAEGLDAQRLVALARRAARAEETIERVADYAEAELARQTAPDRIVLGAGFARLPAEVALRLLGRTIARVGHEGPVELGKLEILFEALVAAMSEARPARFRRTLAGALVTLAGEISVEAAPPRRSRQRKP